MLVPFFTSNVYFDYPSLASATYEGRVKAAA